MAAAEMRRLRLIVQTNMGGRSQASSYDTGFQIGGTVFELSDLDCVRVRVLHLNNT
jgi:hypothetical protein